MTGAGDVDSLKTFFWLAVAGKTMAVYLLMMRLTRRPLLAASYTAGAGVLTIGCFGYWVYPWDYLDAILLSLFLLGIAGERGWGWFAALFVVGLWNREAALFLPLWFVIDSVKRESRPAGGRSRVRIEARQFLGASGALVLGLAAIWWMRQALFIHRSDASDDLLDLRHAALANHVTLLRNVQEFFVEFRSLGQGPPGRARLIAGCCALAVVVALLTFRRLTFEGRKLLLWSVCVTLGVVTFGTISEARIWIWWIPNFLFWVAVLAGPARFGAAARFHLARSRP